MLTISLTVDKSLEPEWLIVNKEHPEGHYISGRDREKLGVMRLGGYINQHLTWRKGSALSRLTGEPDDIDMILADANPRSTTKYIRWLFNTLSKSCPKSRITGKGFRSSSPIDLYS